MRLVLVAACLALATASPAVKDVNIEKKESVAASAAPEQPLKFYHKDVGIPEARRLKQAEKEASNIQYLMAGGEPSSANAYPYLVGVIVTLNTHVPSICGASMLTNTRAVTAAHCWWDGDNRASKFELVFGSLRLYSGGVRVDTDDVEMHANWNPPSRHNDIAIIKFKSVGYTDAIQPVALPSGALLDDDFAGKSAQAVGFGKTSDNVPFFPSQNQYQSHVTLQVITNAACQEKFGSTDVIASNICTSGEGGKGPCTGDSGAPLTITAGEKTVLIGLASFQSAYGCVLGHPAVFTRVTSYATWIQDRI